jgi:hypothetical protein
MMIALVVLSINNSYLAKNCNGFHGDGARTAKSQKRSSVFAGTSQVQTTDMLENEDLNKHGRMYSSFYYFVKVA